VGVTTHDRAAVVLSSRDRGDSQCKITVADNVWLGGGLVVCPGVRTGADTVVGAGGRYARSPGWCHRCGRSRAGPPRVRRRGSGRDLASLTTSPRSCFPIRPAVVYDTAVPRPVTSRNSERDKVRQRFSFAEARNMYCEPLALSAAQLAAHASIQPRPAAAMTIGIGRLAVVVVGH
jgi:hypothetical protein